MKTCSRCRRELPDDNFRPIAGTNRRMARCKRCVQDEASARCKAKRQRAREQRDERKILQHLENCQGCGAPVDGDALCGDCRKAAKNCLYCIFHPLCRVRLQQMLWVLCEVPDKTDMERVKALYGQPAMSF